MEAVTVVPAPSPAFAQVVAQLDTPEKLSMFLQTEFERSFHDGCISYWPEEFYSRRAGDCKDFATFASYVLAQHGHYAEMVKFRYYGQDGTTHGHSVLIFESEGTLWYMSNGRIVSQVESVADLLEKESEALGGDIYLYVVLPAGTAGVCP
jgi:hypothetical protein